MITQPENYRYWLKKAFMAAFPCKHDFDVLREALMDTGRVICVLIIRVLILLTLPISVPVLAYFLLRANIKTAARNKAAFEKAWNSAKPLSQRDKE